MSKKNIPIEVSEIDLNLMGKQTADLPALIEYAHSRGGFAIVPTKQGAIKSKAMEALKGQTNMQLDMLFEQMRLLAKQVKTIKDRVDISYEIYEADIHFQPVIGQTYYLYRQVSGKNILSLIGPDEWKESKGFSEFISSVELLADHTWKVVE
jgi:hypothetical protein